GLVRAVGHVEPAAVRKLEDARAPQVPRPCRLERRERVRTARRADEPRRVDPERLDRHVPPARVLRDAPPGLVDVEGEAPPGVPRRGAGPVLRPPVPVPAVVVPAPRPLTRAGAPPLDGTVGAVRLEDDGVLLALLDPRAVEVELEPALTRPQVDDG